MSEGNCHNYDLGKFFFILFIYLFVNILIINKRAHYKREKGTEEGR